ncbi:Hypothetical protein SRAE_2000384600 [Strongyloides ratti]|uniref:Uncharacterized protein n=1 Tax=Strongyloides ratti TaxID=34506 RepID=A0A090LHF8_STRRB|nr:Hypothetical protein SRAE_2000384600 [Strongyloides ratti]CEF69196.1 Hypothetical protein SRAE_2000384600 [Strongyloides ratti]
MFKFSILLFLFILLSQCNHLKKLKLLGSTRNSVAVKIDDNVFTFNFYDDFHVSGNITIYEDDKYEVKNSAGRVVYVDREDYSPKMILKNEKNKTIYSETVSNLMELRTAIVYIFVAFIIILLGIICFFSYQFSITSKLFKKLNKSHSTAENVYDQNSSIPYNSVNSSSFVSDIIKDNYISDIKTIKAISFGKEKERSIKFLIMSKTGELMIKTNKIKNFKCTELTPKTLSSIGNLLGFMALIEIKSNNSFLKDSEIKDLIKK